MLRTVQSLPPCRAFDTGLRPDPFPHRAASLLPGLLAATRTGLPPASDDELTTTDQPPTRSTSCLLGAREWLTTPRKLPERPRPHPRQRAFRRHMEGPGHPLRATKDTRTRGTRTKDTWTKDTWTKGTWTKDPRTKDPLEITKAATCKIAVAANVSGRGLVV